MPRGFEIDYNFNFSINENTNSLSITGEHDAFPSYVISSNGNLIYDYQQDGLLDLLGSGDDVTVNINVNLGSCE